MSGLAKRLGALAWVRAVSAGVADPTPAKKTFSVVHVGKR